MALYMQIVCGLTRLPKFIAAGAHAGWLWVGGLGYCKEHLTDGFIPDAVVPTLAPGVKQPAKSAEMLVSAGLWESVNGGYLMHDYHEHNPTKALVEKKRKDAVERKRRQRDRDEMSQRDTRVTALTGAPVGAGSGYGIGNGSEGVESEESARETTPPAWGQRRSGAGQRADGLVTTHPKCDPATFLACNRGICVPHTLAAEWRQQMDPDRSLPDVATNEIKATVRAGLALLPETGAVPDDGFTFWRGVWKTRHSRTSARAAANVNAPSGPDWFDDCKALHANECSSKAAHESRVFSENFRAEQAEAAKGRAS